MTEVPSGAKKARKKSSKKCRLLVSCWQPRILNGTKTWMSCVSFEWKLFWTNKFSTGLSLFKPVVSVSNQWPRVRSISNKSRSCCCPGFVSHCRSWPMAQLIASWEGQVATVLPGTRSCRPSYQITFVKWLSGSFEIIQHEKNVNRADPHVPPVVIAYPTSQKYLYPAQPISTT